RSSDLRLAARRPTRGSRGASASRARYARSPAPAPPTNSPSPSPATAWCAATAASPATAGAWSASAGCWSARPRSEPEPQAEVDRARLPRLQQCVALPCTVAHRELPDIRLVAQVAQLAEQRPALALDAHPQAEQVVRTDLVGVAEIRVAPADQVERRSRVEAAVVTVHHLAAHHVARCPGQGVVAVVGIAVEREGVPARADQRLDAVRAAAQRQDRTGEHLDPGMDGAVDVRGQAGARRLRIVDREDLVVDARVVRGDVPF